MSRFWLEGDVVGMARVVDVCVGGRRQVRRLRLPRRVVWLGFHRLRQIIHGQRVCVRYKSTFTDRDPLCGRAVGGDLHRQAIARQVDAVQLEFHVRPSPAT